MNRTKNIPAKDLVPNVSCLATSIGVADQLVTHVWYERSQPGVVFFHTISGEYSRDADELVRVVA